MARLKLYSAPRDILEFLNFVASKKRVFEQWCYLHLECRGPEEDLSIDEMVQFLGFYFKEPESGIFAANDRKEFVLIGNRGDFLAAKQFEKELCANFPGYCVQVTTRGFEASGLDIFAKIMERHIDLFEPRHTVALTRLRRPVNNVMVLDDDLMVTRQLEKMLSGSAFVIVLNNPQDLLAQYTEYAPDILFLDIHLRTAMGTTLLRDLRKKIDPHAHVVMISSDTGEKTVMEVKAGGAKGFIVKPFDRMSVLKHLSRAPTFVQRMAAA